MTKVTELPVASVMAGDEETIIIQDGHVKRAPFALASSSAEYFGSIATPPESGVTASAATSGQVQLTGARTTLVGTAGTAAALWGSAQSLMMIVDLDRELVDGRNIRCAALGTIGGNSLTASLTRSVLLQYISRTHGTADGRGEMVFHIRGESSALAWKMRVALPAAAKGPFVVLAWNDAADGYLSVYDIPTATWHDSSAAAKPASWGGLSKMTNELAVFGDGAYTFPADNSGARQNSNQWIGAGRDLIFANIAMTKANALAILNGADPATELGEASNLRLHVPMAVDGAFSTTVSGEASSGVTVTQLGALYQGPSIKRQGAANYVTIDRMPTVFGTNPKSTQAFVQLSGTHGGTATGTLQIRMVGRSGVIYRDWTDATNTGSAGAWACSIYLPEAPELVDIHARFSGATRLIANTGARHWVKPVVIAHGQSEAVLSIFDGSAARASATATTLNIGLVAGADRVSVAATSWQGVYCRAQSGELAGYLGDEATAIADIIGPEQPCHIVLNAISGTSMIHMMNDAETARQWSDTLARTLCIANVDEYGRIPVTAHVIVGWEAFYSGTDGVMAGAYKPFLTGAGSNDIAQADIDHWLFDGTFSDQADVIVMPCNRASAVAAAAASATDASTEADQRDQMRNWAHLLGYTVGPEATTHKLQGEDGASGALVAGTHPEDDDYEGDVEMAVFNAESIRMALGRGRYPGPVFFESIAAGSAANKVIVTLGDPRPFPGEGLSTDATGYSTAAQRVGRSAINLHTKLGGNAGAGFEASIDGGAWSKANVTSGSIISPRQVELTLASTPSTSVSVRYHPGVPGAYSTATITQDNWRAGALFFTGSELSGAPASLADVRSLGFAVSGSNQALVLTL